MAVCLAFSRAPLISPNRCDARRGSMRTPPQQSDGATGPALAQAEPRARWERSRQLYRQSPQVDAPTGVTALCYFGSASGQG
jgi:hypothetical protein